MGLTGVVSASTGLIREVKPDNETFHHHMQALAEKGEACYRELTEQTPGFSIISTRPRQYPRSGC